MKVIIDDPARMTFKEPFYEGHQPLSEDRLAGRFTVVTPFAHIAGERPFGGSDFDELVANVLKLNYSLPDGLSLEVRQAIDSMLQLTPSDRASVAELCVDPWVLKDGGGVAPEMRDGQGASGSDVELGAQGGGIDENERSGAERSDAATYCWHSSMAWRTLYAVLVMFALAAHVYHSSGSSATPAFTVLPD